jgi:TRAP-type C4-dicarboxylate transport system permease small subunit
MHVLKIIASAIDFVLQRIVPGVCAAMLALMVIFILYTVVMRSVFLTPPFWGDTLTLFANIWMVMLAFSLAVRQRSNIAMEVIYTILPSKVSKFLSRLWTALFGVVGLLMMVQGYEVASQILGSYWELGNMPKSYPMMILPITGFLVVVAAILALTKSALVSSKEGESKSEGTRN